MATPIDVDFNLLLRRLVHELESARETYSLDDESRQPPAKYYAQYLPNPTMEQMEEACDKANHDAQCKAAQGFFARLDKDVSRLRTRFQEFLFVEEEDKWPKKWMVRNAKINAMLDKTKWGNVMNDLWGEANMEMTKDLAELLPREKTILRAEGKEHALVLFTVDTKEMAARLHMSPALAQRYIQRFAEAGIIKEQGRVPGRYGVKIYSIGYWVRFKKGWRRVPFLIDTPEWREKLRNFRVDLKEAKLG